MPRRTLTEVAYTTRMTIKWGTIGGAVLLILWSLASAAYKSYLIGHPAATPPPHPGFGPLPMPYTQKSDNPNLTFVLQTATGDFPKNLSSQAKVYFMPRQNSGFFNLDSAKSMARKLRFANDPAKLNETVYQWNGSLGETMTINILTGDFNYTYDYLADQSLLGLKNLPRKEVAVQTAKSFLTSAVDSLAVDLPVDHIDANYLTVKNGKLVPAISLSEADFVRVVFRRQEYDSLPVVSPDTNGNIWVLLSGSDQPNKNVVGANYYYHSIDPQRFETYLLKNSRQAWEELLNGHYWLAGLDDGHPQQITIRRISLAYLDPTNNFGYLEPVYTFSGDADFMAYVPAIDSAWLQQ